MTYAGKEGSDSGRKRPLEEGVTPDLEPAAELYPRAVFLAGRVKLVVGDWLIFRPMIGGAWGVHSS
jgi:hypothetical protein